MKGFWKTVLSIITALVIITGVTGGYKWLDSNYARAEDVKMNSVEIKITAIKGDIRWYKDQMNQILRENKCRDAQTLPEYAYRQWQQYFEEVKMLEMELKNLMEKRR